MNDRERLWERVNLALDERRDPLEDALVQRLVAERPELADELVRLQERLATLRARPKRAWRVAAILVAFAAAISVLFALRNAPSSDPTPAAAIAVTPPPAPDAPTQRSQVLAFEATAVHEDPFARTTTTFDGVRTTTLREVFADPARSSAPAFVAVASSFSVRR